MSEKIAKEDIVVRNELGQNVVVVPKGQPIPEGFDEAEAAAKGVPIRQAEDEAEPAAGKAVDAPAENKSRTSSSRKKKG